MSPTEASPASPLPVPISHKSTVASLFGDDADTEPLWFKKDAFSSKSFDPESYIADLRRFVPFETLRAELRGHLGGLKNELLESTDPTARSVHSTNPQNLVETMKRSKIYQNTYWKEQCFGLTGICQIEVG